MSGLNGRNNVIQTQAQISQNNSPLYDAIFEEGHTHIGEQASVAYMEHKELNFFEQLPIQSTQNAVNWGDVINFEIPKTRSILNGMTMRVRFPPANLITTSTGVARTFGTLAGGYAEQCMLAKYAALMVFQKQQLLHLNQTQEIQQFHPSIQRYRNTVGNTEYQNGGEVWTWEDNLGANQTHAQKQAAMFGTWNGTNWVNLDAYGQTNYQEFTYELSELYWDQNKHDGMGGFFPMGFSSALNIALTLAQPQNIINTNIVTKTDIVQLVPLVSIYLNFEEVGVTMYQHMLLSRYPKSRMINFVDIVVVPPIPLPISTTLINPVTVDLSKLIT